MKYFLALLIILLPLVGYTEQVVPVDKVENSVNIRLNADTTSDVVGELRQGESLTLVKSTDGWHEVQLEGGATGFISSDWSRVVADADLLPDEEAAVAEVETVVEEVTVEDAIVEESIVEEAVVDEAIASTVDVVVEEAVEQVVVEEVVEDVVVEETITASDVKGDRDFVVKVRREGELVSSQIFDNGNRVGIGSTDPQQRLEVNGSIQIHDQNSSVAGLMITQASGDTGYIMHNRASTLTIGAGSIDRITIDRDGHVGIGVSRPEHPLEMASGAHVTAGGVWTNRSSRDSKENIAVLSPGDAVTAVMALQPVSFNYREERGEHYVGFIAEDVPRLLASSDGQSLSTMDIVAALTKVVQEQQRRIDELEVRLEQAHSP